MIEIKNIVLSRENNRPLLIDSYYSEDFTNQPIAIFCHGYKGFKDWGAWNIMARAVAKCGITLIKFNFSHNGGTVEEPIDFPDLEAFGQNNYTKEIDDLGDVINWTQDYFKSNPHVDSSNINLIGHSRGGGIVILKAAEDHRIKRLITLAGVSDYGKRFGTPEDLKLWKKNGVKFVINGRTKQQMPHYYQFYEDFCLNKDRLDIKKATAGLSIPHMIIHGDKDASVSIEEAYAMHEWNPNSYLHILQNTDHVFNTKHPWTEHELSEELQEVVEKVCDFIN